MAQSFDLVVIGTGTAGSVIAMACRGAGWSVAIADPRPFGGTCALRGCDPKKTLLGAAEALDSVRRLEGHGVNPARARIDWPELVRFKRTFTEPYPEGRQKRFDEAGIVSFHGRARFTGPNRLSVDGQTLEGRCIAICAGRHPRPLGIPGEDLLITSDQFMELDSLPKRIVFVGGGYIAFEFAHLANRAGAKVTIVHRGARVLPGFDPDLTDRLVEHSRSLGITIRTGTEVIKIDKSGKGLRIGGKSGKMGRSFQADCAVHAAGRVPELEDMDLEAGNVMWSEKGVSVNEYGQSVSNTSVYAAGDASSAGNAPLTPSASYEAGVVAANLLEPRSRELRTVPVPSVVFSIPPLARVGMSEAEARQSLNVRVAARDTAGWAYSKRLGEEVAGTKILVEEISERIVGAHLLGHNSEELINLFALAIRANMTVNDLKETLYAYPTKASDIEYMF